MKKKMDTLIRKAIFESINELNLYHSSYANFNKFNHKKYLSSGAGSQTFGWGTYLTDSYPIAKSYAEKFILFEFNKFILSVEPLDYIPFSYDEEIIKEVEKLFKRVVRLDISLKPDGKWTKSSFYDFFKIDNGNPENIYDNALEAYENCKQASKEFCEKHMNAIFNEDLFNKNYFANNNVLDKTKDEYINEFNKKNTIYKLCLKLINDVWDDADAHVKKEAYIYEVEIPDDNGFNYLYYSDVLNKKTTQMIENGISRLYMKYNDKINIHRLKMAIEDCYVGKMNGKMMYEELTSIFNKSEKAASLFLLNCGIDGIKYKAGTIYSLPNDADENSYNYVIFDANKVKINSKNLFIDNF